MWFEEFTVGQRIETAGATLSEAQILAFAWDWDPQPFHIDAEAAAQSQFGGLIASGFHTLAVSFRLIWATGLFAGGGAGSPGIEALRWLKPVRPGDRLRAVVEVMETRPSTSRPERGSVRFRYETLNQRDEPVLEWFCWVMFTRRAE